MVLIDYAGGVGDLSLLAKELGIGTVIYNDISDELAKDARCADRYESGCRPLCCD